MCNLFLKEAIPVTEQNWAEDIQPVVSVFNWSYNHVNFIRQSIESILEQKTTFPIEIIIHDDASNDGTIDIIREYESKYPRLFRNIIQKENQWSQGKSVMDPLFKTPRGKYIALTHGDDYWTDPYKLQKQVDFLEKNDGYSACAHANFITDTLGAKKLKQFSMSDFIINTEDLINEELPFHTSSFLYKADLNTSFIQFYISFSKSISGDIIIFVLASKFGKIYYSQEPRSVYRRHIGGVTLSNNHLYDTKFLINRIIMWVLLKYQFNETKQQYFDPIIQRFIDQLKVRVKKTKFNDLLKNINFILFSNKLYFQKKIYIIYVILKSKIIFA